ncbi:MAG TPA: GrpB family protein [Ensifer sp.]|nr:GrpB family protein [Ensifer sp.]
MPTLVRLVPYDDEWPRQFEAAAEWLRELLRDKVAAIDHIGSTSIPGMTAKPLIDIDVTLTDLAVIPTAGALLVIAGFEARGNRYDDDMWAFLLNTSAPALRVYLCPPENETHRQRLLFRIHLQQNVEIAAQYAELKNRLAREFPYDGDRYTAAKSEFVREVVERAIRSEHS